MEVYPSIGGWTLSDPFPNLAANPAARKKFADNCVKLIEAYDFDGIDIDWEYPGYLDHNGTPEDTVNYSLFLQDIRDALDVLGHTKGRFFGLTAALPCGPDLIKNIQIDKVSKILTELNLMTYDFHGSWNAKTGINAPLYDMDGSPEFSVHRCVENWKLGGGFPDQINIGLPFYGRSFGGKGITGMGQSFGNSADQAAWGEDDGSPQYFNIVKKISAFTSVRDEQTKTQYAYNHGGLVSYDDERAICDKTEYAMDSNLNGYIIWEISGDLLEDLSTPLLDAVNDRLNYPGVRCDLNAVEAGAMVEQKEDASWYPDQSFGFCLNDGKHLEKFISPALVYGSAETCCKDFYTFNNDCKSHSLDPRISGKWVEGVTQGDPWYPVDSLKFCLNDGKHVENFISFGRMYGSAKACCNDVYKSNDDCESHSLDPGNSGKWLDGITQGDPWYPVLSLGFCLSDGKHAVHSISSDWMFGSAKACCNNVYKLNNNCESHSLDPGTSGKWVEGVTPGNPWYKHPTTNRCVNDGNHGNQFIQTSQMYSTEDSCCDAYYSDGNCVSESSIKADEGKWYKAHDGCTTKSPVPDWIKNVYDTEEQCCKKHFQNNYGSCLTAPQATTNPTKEPENPNYENGEEVTAQLKPQPTPTVDTIWDSSITEHTQMYDFFFSDDNDEGMWVGQLYYPDFERNSCVNDGKQLAFMAGDYLSDNLFECCNNFYGKNDEMLSECIDKPVLGCVDCSLSDYLTDFYHTESSATVANMATAANVVTAAKVVTVANIATGAMVIMPTPTPPPSTPSSLSLLSPTPGVGFGVGSASNYCGSDWLDANSKCATPCPGGTNAECLDGEKCFADCNGCVVGGSGGGGGPCGLGNVGNGNCVGGLCCSQYGWCGSGPEYCSNAAVSVVGPCGSGNVGNGICDGGLCCSQHGWCGSGPKYCSQ